MGKNQPGANTEDILYNLKRANGRNQDLSFMNSETNDIADEKIPLNSWIKQSNSMVRSASK